MGAVRWWLEAGQPSLEESLTAYEDGIVVNGSTAGPVQDLSITRNLIYANYYAGVRFVGAALTDATIDHNTLVDKRTGPRASDHKINP